MPVMMDSEKVKYQDVHFTNTYLTRQNFYVQRLPVFFIYACYQFDSESAAGDYDFQITYKIIITYSHTDNSNLKNLW